MHSTRSSSISPVRISASTPGSEARDAFAMTNPAVPPPSPSTCRCKVMDKMLNPRVVSIAYRRCSIFPPNIVGKRGTGPVRHIERWIGDDVVGLEGGELVAEERVRPFDFAVDAPDGEVHQSQPPGSVVGLLTVDGDVATDGGTDFGPLAVAITGGVGLHELGGLHEHATGTAARIEDTALVGLEHLAKGLDHTLGRVELTAELAFGGGKLG